MLSCKGDMFFDEAEMICYEMTKSILFHLVSSNQKVVFQQ